MTEQKNTAADYDRDYEPAQESDVWTDDTQDLDKWLIEHREFLAAQKGEGAK